MSVEAAAGIDRGGESEHSPEQGSKLRTKSLLLLDVTHCRSQGALLPRKLNLDHNKVLSLADEKNATTQFYSDYSRCYFPKSGHGCCQFIHALCVCVCVCVCVSTERTEE